MGIPFRKMGLRPRAFTLIELMIAVIIIAILSMALFVNFSGAVLKARFDDELTSISRMVEQARGYALSNYLVNDDESTPAEYYLLSFRRSRIVLSAVAEDGTREELESHSFDTSFSLNTTLAVYYFPPDGSVCFSADCSDGLTESSLIFSDTDGTYSSTITISVYGGFAEIEELL